MMPRRFKRYKVTVRYKHLGKWRQITEPILAYTLKGAERRALNYIKGLIKGSTNHRVTKNVHIDA